MFIVVSFSRLHLFRLQYLDVDLKDELKAIDKSIARNWFRKFGTRVVTTHDWIMIRESWAFRGFKALTLSHSNRSFDEIIFEFLLKFLIKESIFFWFFFLCNWAKQSLSKLLIVSLRRRLCARNSCSIRFQKNIIVIRCAMCAALRSVLHTISPRENQLTIKDKKIFINLWWLVAVSHIANIANKSSAIFSCLVSISLWLAEAKKKK